MSRWPRKRKPGCTTCGGCGSVDDYTDGPRERWTTKQCPECEQHEDKYNQQAAELIKKNGGSLLMQNAVAELLRMADQAARTAVVLEFKKKHPEPKLPIPTTPDAIALEAEGERITNLLTEALDDVEKCCDALDYLSSNATIGPAILANIDEAGRNEIETRRQHARKVLHNTHNWKKAEAQMIADELTNLARAATGTAGETQTD